MEEKTKQTKPRTVVLTTSQFQYSEKPHVFQFLNGGLKLITVFCKLTEDKDISEVVMTQFSDYYENYKDMAAHVVTNGNYFVSLILVRAITFLDICLLFFNRFHFV